MKNTEANNIEIAVIDDRSIRDKIYEIRGMKVMLDFDLAEIYGYTTSAFNQQVKRNEERFPSDFRFQLTQEEIEILSRSQNVILNKRLLVFFKIMIYNRYNRTQHASQRCGPRWVF